MAHFNQNQHVALLAEIAMIAGQVAEIALLIQEKSSSCVEADVLSASVDVMARRIGWLTVIARQGHNGEELGGAVADEWIMPPMVVAEGEVWSARKKGVNDVL